MKNLRVLFISGWAHGVEAMCPLADVMRDSHPVSSFSLAELLMQGKRGDSQNGAISPYARAISRHLDESGEPACIVGWSAGGLAAIEAAANNPEKVVALVLLSTTARFCSAKEYTSGADPAALRAMIRKFKRSPETVIADFLSQAVLPMIIPADELACRTQNALRQGTDSLIHGLEYLAQVDLRDALRAISVPCLIIHGRQDRIVPWQAAQFLASNLPLSNAEFSPSAGHLLIEQCPKDLTQRIAQFVGTLR
jgi:pimeloyl-[acyl-carrier protein] methyl ester esterase